MSHEQLCKYLRTPLLLTAALMLTVAGFAAAAEPVSASNGLTLAGGPLAIHGYDPVAYFAEGRALRGQAEHSVLHDGAVYRFDNAENKAAFEGSPERYAPQFGGFCAYGIAVGKKFDGDPEVFEIVDDKLYFNLNPAIQATWSEDIPGNIAKAVAQWRRIAKTPAAAL